MECDTEAYEIWKTHLPEDHILKGNKKVRLFGGVDERITFGKWAKWVPVVPVLNVIMS